MNCLYGINLYFAEKEVHAHEPVSYTHLRFDQFSDQLKEDNVDEVYVTTNNEIVYTLKNDRCV